MRSVDRRGQHLAAPHFVGVWRLGAVALVTAAVVLGFGIALARSPWVTQTTPVQPKAEASAPGVSDPVAPPTEIADGPLSLRLAAALDTIPAIAALEQVKRADFSEGAVDAAVLAFLAPDGAMVNVVYQQLPEPLSVDSIGPPENTHAEIGPGGEDLIIKDATGGLQVIGVDDKGHMVNVIVDRLSPSEPGRPSELASWDVEMLKSWVVGLLKAMNG
jgi:hypothetical protein